MSWPPPLRLAIPLMLLLFAGTAGIISIRYGRKIEEQALETSMREHAQSLGTRLAGMSAFFMENLIPAGEQREIALSAIDRNLSLALVVDAADTVLYSTRYDLIGRTLADTPAAHHTPLLQEVRRTRAGEVAFTSDGRTLFGAFPFPLTPRAGGTLRNTDYGVVLLEFDLGERRAALEANAARRVWLGASVLLGLTVLFWVLFAPMLTKRVSLLARTARQVAKGDLSARAGLEGSDEIATLARTFDRMAADLQQRETEQRQREAERQELERNLQETQKLESLGVLAGGIAHDFNNLLTGILGNASLAREELSATSPALASLEQIEAAALRAADLCKQMLAYSGKGRFQIQRLDLSAIVRETTQLIQLSIAKTAVLRFQLAESLPPVEADATQIRQVVMNLVINASEALDGKSGVISISTGHTHADRAYLESAVLSPELPEGDYAFLEVGDNGCGMSSEQQARIFEPFYTTKFTGRGLGLSAVLGIVRGHGGALRVYSEEGKGTTFKIILPLAEGAAEPLTAETTANQWQGAGTVLVVDDELSVRKVTTRMLERIGFGVITAGDGREGVEIFRAQCSEIVAVLIDLTMPHMDGETAFRELRALAPEVRVILMSGFDEQEAIHRFAGKGLAGFIQKPFNLEMLRQKLQEGLGAAGGVDGRSASPQ